MKKHLVLIPLIFIFVGSYLLIDEKAPAEKSVTSTSIAMKGVPKYKEGFLHFDYVNPQAPKGGRIVRRAIGTYDSFHSYAPRGSSVSGSGLLYDTLMTGSADELDVLYPLIAEKIEYTLDFKQITFFIDPRARFQDGSEITADDVYFSYTILLEKSAPYFKQYFQKVTDVEVLTPSSIRFTLGEGDKELLLTLASLDVIPEKYWQDRDFSEPQTEVPLGSGPYTISDYKMGQYVVYKRLDNHWAKDLPVRKGLYNFDEIRFDYYRDEYISLEAFKAGEYDLISENIAKNWATMYSGKNFEKGYIVKETIEHEKPQRMQALIFNTARPKFEDRRVRKALSLMFDFDWMNKNLFYDQYTRTRSFFQNTDYEADELPTQDELALLDPFRDELPDEVFSTVYQPMKYDGSGYNRDAIRQALSLFKEAGWVVKKTKLVNEKTGKQFSFEVLLYSPSMERVMIPFQRNLERIGIDFRIRTVDTTQFINRVRNSDFDVMNWVYNEYAYPSSGLMISFHSRFIDPKLNPNYPSVRSKAIDSLLEQIVQNQNNDKKLVYLGRAFDRVLMHGYYMIPEWHLSRDRLAYWNKFSRPEKTSKYGYVLMSWWYDDEKAEQLKK